MCAMEDDNVKALLRRCAGTLLSAVSRMSNGNASGTNTEPEPNGSSRNAPVVITSEDSNRQNNSTFTRGTAATATVRESAIEEHRRLFNFQPSTGRTGNSPYLNSRKGNDRKRRKVSDKPQWNHIIVCLSSTD